MEVVALKRVFKYKDIELEDPNENLSVKDVLKYYSGIYPELITGSIMGPVIKQDKEIYTLSSSYKPKG